MHIFPRRHRLVPLLCAIALCILLALTSRTIIERAESAAAGRSYCIDITDGRYDYHATTSLLDLMPWRMRATLGRRGDYHTFHAVLFAERPEAKSVKWGQAAFERYNWSYQHLRFMPIVGQGHAFLGDRPTCVPRPSFASTLPLFR